MYIYIIINYQDNWKDGKKRNKNIKILKIQIKKLNFIFTYFRNIEKSWIIKKINKTKSINLNNNKY